MTTLPGLERPAPCLAGVTGSDLKKRIEFITAGPHTQPLDRKRRMLLALAAAGAILGPVATGIFFSPPALAQGQADDNLQFEVASVKPFVFGSAPENNTITAVHGILRMPQQSLRDCIAWAYNLGKADDVEGPASLDTEHYDIEGKAAGTTTQEQLRVMLQNLLRERFHLTLHRKTVQRPVYSLVVGKDGPKLKEVQKEPVKGAFMQTESGTFSIQMVNRISKLTEFLRIFLDHPVLDRTELTGVYDMTLKVEVDDTEMHKLQPGQMFDGFGLTPGVFPAVEQLGLKLVAQKGPVDILVVDHVEPPQVN